MEKSLLSFSFLKKLEVLWLVQPCLVQWCIFYFFLSAALSFSALQHQDARWLKLKLYCFDTDIHTRSPAIWQLEADFSTAEGEGPLWQELLSGAFQRGLQRLPTFEQRDHKASVICSFAGFCKSNKSLNHLIHRWKMRGERLEQHENHMPRGRQRGQRRRCAHRLARKTQDSGFMWHAVEFGFNPQKYATFMKLDGKKKKN